MGYLPKHIKVKRYKLTMRIIATAALSGAVFERRMVLHSGDTLHGATQASRPVWGIIYSDGQQSFNYDSKSEAASIYLFWWFGKQGVFPRWRT